MILETLLNLKEQENLALYVKGLGEEADEGVSVCLGLCQKCLCQLKEDFILFYHRESKVEYIQMNKVASCDADRFCFKFCS